MAENISIDPNDAEKFKIDDEQVPTETKLAQLIEYISHNVYRPASRERSDEVVVVFRELLVNLLKELHINQIESIVDHLEERLKNGQHDMVVEFLSNVAKLQHTDFAQEFLKFQTVPIPADDISGAEASRIGHAVITNY